MTRQWDQTVGPGSGAVVMSTGIVSIALSLGHHELGSLVLLGLAGLLWAALGLLVCWRVARDRTRVLAEARSPAGLTGVAATAVIGTRVAALGWRVPAIVLFVLAAAAWPLLTSLVAGRLSGRADGNWFMLAVAPEALAALAAALAVDLNVGWLLDLALVLGAAGLSSYPLVLVRFDRRDLATAHGEHWIAGGSLAISALAFSQIAIASEHLGVLPQATAALKIVSAVLWAAAMLWLVPLILSELRWPRPRYRARRWSTVFPLSMYAACSFTAASATGTMLIADFARAWTWVALVGWALAFAGMMRSGARLLADRGGSNRRLAVTRTPDRCR